MIDLPGFLDLIAEAWAIDVGSPIAQFHTKIKHTKQALRSFNKKNGDVHSNVQEATATLEEV